MATLLESNPLSLSSKTGAPKEAWNGYRWYGSDCLGSKPTRKGYLAPDFLPISIMSSKVFGASLTNVVLRTRAMFSVA